MKYNHWIPKMLTKIIPKIRINAIVLFGTIYFAESEDQVDERLYQHELKHVEQQNNEGILFYFRYFYEYLKNRLKGMSHGKAYLLISYEIEARKAEK